MNNLRKHKQVALMLLVLGFIFSSIDVDIVSAEPEDSVTLIITKIAIVPYWNIDFRRIGVKVWIDDQFFIKEHTEIADTIKPYWKFKGVARHEMVLIRIKVIDLEHPEDEFDVSSYEGPEYSPHDASIRLNVNSRKWQTDELLGTAAWVNDLAWSKSRGFHGIVWFRLEINDIPIVPIESVMVKLTFHGYSIDPAAISEAAADGRVVIWIDKDYLEFRDGPDDHNVVGGPIQPLGWTFTNYIRGLLVPIRIQVRERNGTKYWDRINLSSKMYSPETWYDAVILFNVPKWEWQTDELLHTNTWRKDRSIEMDYSSSWPESAGGTVWFKVERIPWVETTDSEGNVKNKFWPVDNVYIKGSGYDPLTAYSPYIVNDAEWVDGMTIPSRVPGTVWSVTTDGSGNIPLGTMAWPSPHVQGKYDIVIDVNDNGKYDVDIDALDDRDIYVTAGFNIVPEVPFGTLMISLTFLTVLALFFVKKKAKT